MEVGEVIQFYDSNKRFPAWGFGGKIPGGTVSHCFNPKLRDLLVKSSAVTLSRKTYYVQFNTDGKQLTMQYRHHRHIESIPTFLIKDKSNSWKLFSWIPAEEDKLVFFPTTRTQKRYPIILKQREESRSKMGNENIEETERKKVS